MLKGCARVVKSDGDVLIIHLSLKHNLPFGKKEAEKWLREDYPDAQEIEVYGPRSNEYKLYMRLSGRKP